ncbi:MAG: exopolysaccharide biosynthesis polyprenyl glycosylphosphotransferase [Planctomycetota bacterium]
MILGMLAVGLYLPRRDRSFDGEFVDICKAGVFGWLGFVLGLLVLDHASPFAANDLARQLLVYPVMLVTALTIHRYIFRLFLRRIRQRGWNLRHMAVIGTGRVGQTAHRTFIENSWTGINVAYYISHHDTVRQQTCANRPVFGGLDDLERVLDERPVDGVIVALPQARSYLLPELLMRLQSFAIEVRVIPDLSPKFMPMNLSIVQLDGIPIVSVRQSPLHGFGGMAKRFFDIVLALLALLVFSIPMLVISLLIRLDSPGPVLFRQTRTSVGGRHFRMWKFRSMRGGEVQSASAEVELHGTAARGGGALASPDRPSGRLGASVRGSTAHSASKEASQARRAAERARVRRHAAWTQRDDPRITRVGRFLRRTSLDELPQLFNVITGDMSLVGPRPERPDLIDDFRHVWRGYALRQNIKAGMTGWAQINGLRGDTDLRKRLQYDLYYIRHWSISFDFRILFMTLFRGFVHPNAH